VAGKAKNKARRTAARNREDGADLMRQGRFIENVFIY
jgi:hypothetical protein